MKIWITWSHWVWKTTLLNELKKEYLNFWYIEENAREVIKQLWRPQEMNKKDRGVFQYIIMMSQIIKEKEQLNFISDRTVFDILAYSKNLYLYDKIKNKFLENKNNYDIVFYIPIEFKLENDWIRFEEKEYQKQVDRKILKLLKKYNIRYITITWNIDERLEQIKKSLK